MTTAIQTDKEKKRAGVRANTASDFAKHPTWALWTGSIVGLVLAFTPLFFVGFIMYGMVAASLAARKGRTRMTRWMLYGMFIFPVAVIHALVMKPTAEVAQEQRSSAWAALPSDDLCAFEDGLAPGPCVKAKNHHMAGVEHSPHDYRDEAKGTF